MWSLMQADKDVAESTSRWYGDIAKAVIQCKHPQAEVMVLASTVLWSGCRTTPVHLGVQSRD